MAFIGHEDGIDWRTLKAGDYYIMQETGEVFDSEHQAEEACWQAETDDDGEPIEDGKCYQVDTYRTRKVEPYLVTRQHSFYREYASVNICRDRDYIPPGMLCGTAQFPELIECDTYAEAFETAKEIAARWAASASEPIEIERDTAECGGDTYYTVLPTGLIFDEEADSILLDNAA